MKGIIVMNKNQLLNEINKARKIIGNSKALDVLENDVINQTTSVEQYLNRCVCVGLEENGLLYVNGGKYPYFYLLRKDIFRLIELLNSTLLKYEKLGLDDYEIMSLNIESIVEQYKEMNEWKNTPKVKKEKTDSLYLIRDTIDNTLKIGRSKKPQKRLNQLQIATSHKLELLYVVKDKGYLEEDVHKRFEKIRLASEWFENDSSIIKYFKEELL